jgi:citrate/tricarballylate utilization protein
MNDVNLVSLAKTDAHLETARIMQICNACRYCEGFCAVFPAMELRRLFEPADTAYLANLCHHCGACYHACQYAPPHEFAINVSQALADRRSESYADFAWPPRFASLFAQNGLVVSIFITVALALTVGLALVLVAPHLFWGIHLGEGAFYRVVPHTIMAGVPLAISAFVLVALVMGWRRYWVMTGGKWSGWSSLMSAARAAGSMRYLGGDNNGAATAGCSGVDERPSLARRYYHHLTFYGFMLCFASTSTGTFYHYVLGREAPYGYFEMPVILGTVGGIMLCLGTAGLWYEKRRMDKGIKPLASLGMDYAFIWLLFWVSATGLILLLLRHTSWMGLTLAVHLGLVYGFFLILPYSKFVHGLYRFSALMVHAGEK